MFERPPNMDHDTIVELFAVCPGRANYPRSASMILRLARGMA